MKPSLLSDRLRARRWIGLWLAVVLALAGGVGAVHAAAHGNGAALAFVAGDGAATPHGESDNASPHDCTGCRLSLAWSAVLTPSSPARGPAIASREATHPGSRPAPLVADAGTRWQQLRKHGPPAFSC
jgi:hypothetical protein